MVAQICLRGSQCFARVVFSCSRQRRRCGHNVLLVCKAAAAFVRDPPGFPKIAYLFSALILGVTGWIYLDHGLSVGWVNFGYVTVRKSVAGGAFAVVGIGFFSIGTSLGGVTVRLFFTVGGIGILRVTVSVLFCSGGTCVSVSSAACVVLRGNSVAWPLLLEALAWVVV